eukprot:3088169-Prymnesium_polylepis.4
MPTVFGASVHLAGGCCCCCRTRLVSAKDASGTQNKSPSTLFRALVGADPTLADGAGGAGSACGKICAFGLACSASGEGGSGMGGPADEGALVLTLNRRPAERHSKLKLHTASWPVLRAKSSGTLGAV